MMKTPKHLPLRMASSDDREDMNEFSAKTYDHLGIQIPVTYLPRAGIEPGKWAVIACDQFTSQPDYWQKVEQIVGDSPSTLNLILPEIYLGEPEEEERVCRAQAEMQAYLENGILVRHEGLIYVERQIDHKTRRGLMVCLDLEKYDYNKGSLGLIRATEGTIIERIPPRMRIRVGATLELPHILVLIDDPQHTVIAPLTQAAQAGLTLEKLYDFDLMLGSGHLSGYLVNDAALETSVIAALEKLADPKLFSQKYGVDADECVMLFAMGDGNHSLATAKNTWDRLKPQVGRHHPARYALVEIVNVHDEALNFEPIHRVLFGLNQDILAAMNAYFGPGCSYRKCTGCEEMTQAVKASCSDKQIVGVVSMEGYAVIELEHPNANMAIGNLQPLLDAFLKEGGAERVDYVHGMDVVCELGSKPGNIGFYLPCMEKDDLFKTVILDGALPRKTFSMGEAHEKRFYMECRKIA